MKKINKRFVNYNFIYITCWMLQYRTNSNERYLVGQFKSVGKNEVRYV